jgi:hypothetical protein
MTNHGTKRFAPLLSATSALSMAAALALTSNSATAADAKWNDQMEFGQAFNAARAELGDGAKFDWRGQTYTTELRQDKAVTGMEAYWQGAITKDELLAEHPEYDKPGFIGDAGEALVAQREDVGGAGAGANDRGGLIPVAFERGDDKGTVEGIIHKVDMTGAMLTLDNGNTYQLGTNDAMDALGVGDLVALVGDEKGWYAHKVVAE